MHKCKPC
ncbi:unnamed protein product, partial [Allacma fusca]